MKITEEKLIALYDRISSEPYVKRRVLLEDLELHFLTISVLIDLDVIKFENSGLYWDEMIPIDDDLVSKLKQTIKDYYKR